MAGRLDGKVVLISGAARGQGAAEARLFAREGARLALGDVLDEPLAKLAAELASGGHEVLARRHDVSSELEWQEFVGAVEYRFGRLDVLVNNAGVVDPAGVEATGRETWDRILAVNQTGTWLGMKATTSMPMAITASVVTRNRKTRSTQLPPVACIQSMGWIRAGTLPRFLSSSRPWMSRFHARTVFPRT